MVFEGNEYSFRPIFLTTRENVPRIPVTQEGVFVLCCSTDPLSQKKLLHCLVTRNTEQNEITRLASSGRTRIIVY